MEIPEKLEAEIKRIFSNNIKLMNKLLNLDADAIRFIGHERDLFLLSQKANICYLQNFCINLK